jgi:hypothetical protein
VAAVTGATLGISTLTGGDAVVAEPSAAAALAAPISPTDTSTERGEHRAPAAAAAERARAVVAAKARARAEAARVAEERRERAARAARKAREERAARDRAARERAARATEERSSRSTARVSSGDAKSIARSMVAARGWSSGQYSCLVTLWDHESGWRVNASNPSGAYGIPQALPGSKMASAGSDWRTNPATQIRWGLGYISDRYGTPCGALDAFNSKGWY